MYRGIELTCPVCATSLVAVVKTTLPIHGCESCGGAWLGSVAAVRVMQGASGEVEDEAVAAARSIRVSRPPLAHEPNQPCACPQCGLVMTSMRAGNVELEMCPAHGTWFDADEVARVAEASRAKERASHPPEESSGSLFQALMDIVHS